MAFEHLKVRPGQRATSAWANTLVDILSQAYWLGKRGDPDHIFHEFYAGYGYFYYDLLVQGKRVIKDGDPVNIYDIFDPAKYKITQSIDQSLLTQYVRETRDVVVKLRIDEYGNVGVVISEPLDVYGNVKVSPRDIDEDLLPASGIIDTGAQSSPVTVITPSPGKRVDVRRAYVSTNSTGGKVYVKFQNTGRLITAIYPSKYGFAVVPAIRIVGDVDEPVVIEWSDIDTGAEISYFINYKEVG